MSHKTNVPVINLQIGMFVSDLDRPWIETPFLLQGFVIENDAEIATLREFCRSVTVDRSRSLGDAFVARDNGKDPARVPEPTLIFYPSEEAHTPTPPDDFANVFHLLRAKEIPRAAHRPPEVSPHNKQSRLEAELLYSAPIIDDVKKALKSIHEAVANAQNISFSEIGGLVGEMACGVERNPDAMLWLARLRSADQYSYDHALDVSVHMMVFARFLGLPLRTIEELGVAGLMQDVGKVEIPAAVLGKAGHLTDEEYQLVQSHVAASLEMLMGHEGFSSNILDIIASHHERADGSGYPRRLKGERIGFHGELAGLVDTYCAMTRDRVYGIAVSSQKALEALNHLRGNKFREPVVDQFIQCIGLYPIGSLVELNSGEVGVVIQQNKVRRLKPRLLIVLGPDKSVERHPITIDLMNDPTAQTGVPYRIVQALPANAYGIDPAEFYIG